MSEQSLTEQSARVTKLISQLKEDLDKLGLRSNMLSQLEQQLLRQLRS